MDVYRKTTWLETWQQLARYYRVEMQVFSSYKELLEMTVRGSILKNKLRNKGQQLFNFGIGVIYILKIHRSTCPLYLLAKTCFDPI